MLPWRRADIHDLSVKSCRAGAWRQHRTYRDIFDQGMSQKPGSRRERELVSRSWCHRPGRRKVLEFRVALSEAFPALASSPAFRACSRPAISESTQTSHRTHYSCTPQETAHTSPTAAVTQRAAAREGRISPPDAPTPTTLTITTVTIYD